MKFRTKIFVLSHTTHLLDKLPIEHHIYPVDLGALPVGVFQNNQLSESRAFFVDWGLWWVSYIGFASARWDEKFPSVLNLASLKHLPLRPDMVWCPMKATPGWIAHSCQWHPGMERLFSELGELTGQSVEDMNLRSTVWCNSFICHKNIFKDLARFVRRYVQIFYHRYGFNLPFKCFPSCYKTDPYLRHFGFWSERLTAWYFASRVGLQVCEIPSGLPKLKREDPKG